MFKKQKVIQSLFLFIPGVFFLGWGCLIIAGIATFCFGYSNPADRDAQPAPFTPEQKRIATKIAPSVRLFLSILEQLPTTAKPTTTNWSLVAERRAMQWFEENVRGRYVYAIWSSIPEIKRDGADFLITCPIPREKDLPVDKIWPEFRQAKGAMKFQCSFYMNSTRFRTRNEDLALRALRQKPMRYGALCQVSNITIRPESEVKGKKVCEVILTLAKPDAIAIDVLAPDDLGLPNEASVSLAKNRPVIIGPLESSCTALTAFGNDKLLTGDAAGNIVLWDIARRKQLVHLKDSLPIRKKKKDKRANNNPYGYIGLPRPFKKVENLTVSADRKTLMAIGLDDRQRMMVRAFQLPGFHLRETSKVYKSFKNAPKRFKADALRSHIISISPDLNKCVILFELENLQRIAELYDLRQNKIVCTIHCSNFTGGALSPAPYDPNLLVQFTPDSRFAVIRHDKKSSEIWDLDKHQCVDTTDSKSAFSISTGRNSGVAVWKRGLGRLYRWYHLPKSKAWAIDKNSPSLITPDAKRVMVADRKKSIHVWRMSDSGFAASSRWVPKSSE